MFFLFGISFYLLLLSPPPCFFILRIQQKSVVDSITVLVFLRSFAFAATGKHWRRCPDESEPTLNIPAMLCAHNIRHVHVQVRLIVRNDLLVSPVRVNHQDMLNILGRCEQILAALSEWIRTYMTICLQTIPATLSFIQACIFAFRMTKIIHILR